MLKFSIGIPAYKDKFFKQCLESVLRQDFDNYEVIVLNDKSPFPIHDIVKEFHSPRLIYLENQENLGGVNLVKNWDKLLAAASGEFLIIMGDDDLMESNYLSTFDALITSYPRLDVYHCRSKIINEKNEIIRLTESWASYESVYDNIWHRLNEIRSQYISDFVYRVEALKEKNGFYNLPLAWGSDDITAFRAAAQKGIAHTNTPVFIYRTNPYSISTSGNVMQKMEANILYGKWLSEFLKQEPQKNDMITYLDLKQNLTRYIQRRKIHVMTVSMLNAPVKQAIKWYRLKNKFKFTLIEILLAMVNAIKRRKGRKTYG